MNIDRVQGLIDRFRSGGYTDEVLTIAEYFKAQGILDQQGYESVKQTVETTNAAVLLNNGQPINYTTLIQRIATLKAMKAWADYSIGEVIPKGTLLTFLGKQYITLADTPRALAKLPNNQPSLFELYEV